MASYCVYYCQFHFRRWRGLQSLYIFTSCRRRHCLCFVFRCEKVCIRLVISFQSQFRQSEVKYFVMHHSFVFVFLFCFVCKFQADQISPGSGNKTLYITVAHCSVTTTPSTTPYTFVEVSVSLWADCWEIRRKHRSFWTTFLIGKRCYFFWFTVTKPHSSLKV